MRYLDIENWNRKAHYSYFKQLDYPHFNICGNVDITEVIRFVKDSGSSFFLTFLYASVKTANSIEEFRYRIREDKVVVHDIVSPSFTVMTSKEVFSFCAARFVDDYKEFCINAAKEMDKTKAQVNIKDEPGRDDRLYITSIPWVTFTGVTHPIHMKPVDSIPRITWGKYFEESGRVKLPLSVQAHHALIDGAHIGQFFMKLQELLSDPMANF